MSYIQPIKTEAEYLAEIREFENRRRTAKKAMEDYIKLYHGEMTQMTRKIKRCTRGLKRVIEGKTREEKRQHEVNDFGALVGNFFSLQLRRSGRTCKPDYVLARQFFFFKYGLEHRMRTIYLAKYVGVNTSSAAKARRNVTRAFRIKPEVKKLWDDFNTYINASKRAL